MKDKKEHHGAVDKPSSNQQFCKTNMATSLLPLLY